MKSMRLRWLQLMQPCTIEIRPLTDNVGQPLTFRPPGLTRRCVTEEVFNHPAVQRYIQRRMLIECDGSSVVKKPAIRAAPVPVVAVSAPAPEEMPVQASEPVADVGNIGDDGLDGEKPDEDSASTPEPNEDGTSSVTLRRRRRR